jgi:hypothetical protein
MKFDALTYSAGSFEDCAVGSQETLSSSPQGADSSACATESLAEFLLRLVAYFQGYLSVLPRCAHDDDAHASEVISVIDSDLDESDGPLVAVRMNRALLRRKRWLIRRGHWQKPGTYRVATAADTAQCNLSPGQMIEYCIRVYRMSRVRAYGLGRGQRIEITGGVGSLGLAAICNAILMPD